MEPLLAALFGWVLNEISHSRRGSRKRTAAVGRALSDLMELRHYLRAVSIVLAELKKRYPLSADEELVGLQWFDHLLPANPHLAERYDSAITELAEDFPVLAFYLRSKEQIPQLLGRLRGVRTSAPNAVELAILGDTFLRAKGLLAIDDAIRLLARHHGVATRFRVWYHLLDKPELPRELMEWLDTADRVIVAGRTSGATPKPATDNAVLEQGSQSRD